MPRRRGRPGAISNDSVIADFTGVIAQGRDLGTFPLTPLHAKWAVAGELYDEILEARQLPHSPLSRRKSLPTERTSSDRWALDAGILRWASDRRRPSLRRNVGSIFSG